MILYYALGGGLGHIARSFALIEKAPEKLLPAIRLLVSSKSAAVARPHSPCPMDTLPARVMSDSALYAKFLNEYLDRHNFSCLVMDTFPFGLLGEFKNIEPDLPRVLVSRYLRWDVYRERCGILNGALWPQTVLMIEQQEDVYLETMECNSRVIEAPWPISLVRPEEVTAHMDRPACCVVHSGSRKEMIILMETAYKITEERGPAGAPDIFTPEKGLFPLERHLSRYSDIVTGAGYAACSGAAILKGRVLYHLHPFPRRFDDQELRLKRMQEGRWGNSTTGNASTAASILWNEVFRLLP